MRYHCRFEAFAHIIVKIPYDDCLRRKDTRGPSTAKLARNASQFFRSG
jgi:hypothetical protein